MPAWRVPCRAGMDPVRHGIVYSAPAPIIEQARTWHGRIGKPTGGTLTPDAYRR